MKKILLLALLLPGCSITAHMPMTRFESPEARGQGWEFQAAYQGRTQVELTPDYSYQAPSYDQPSVEIDHNLLLRGAYSLGHRWDINYSFFDSRLGIKYQLLGDPSSEAGVGNIPVSLYAGTAWVEKKANDQDDFSYSYNGRTYALRQLRQDIGLAMGYRTSSSVLFYGGPYVIWNFLRTKYALTAASPETSSEATALMVGVNLGVQIEITKDGFFTRVEGAGAQTKLGGSKVGRGSYGVSLGYYL